VASVRAAGRQLVTYGQAQVARGQCIREQAGGRSAIDHQRVAGFHGSRGGRRNQAAFDRVGTAANADTRLVGQ
jgi:hypothetical protein